MKKYLVAYTVTVETKEEKSREEVEDLAWTIMEATYIKPSINDVTNDKS